MNQSKGKKTERASRLLDWFIIHYRVWIVSYFCIRLILRGGFLELGQTFEIGANATDVWISRNVDVETARIGDLGQQEKVSHGHRVANAVFASVLLETFLDACKSSINPML